MQFRDLKKQYQSLKKEIDPAIQQVLTTGNFISGIQVTELEEQLSAYVGVKHCITCGNGTDALTLALMVWNIGPGDAVFVPDFTFFASGETPAYEGAVPIFVDVEEDTFNMSPSSLEEAIWQVKREGKLIPRVIIAVDLFGQPADYPEIRRIAEKYGLLILEDGAQGFGGRIGERKACSFGDISTTSFFPAKPLGCYGDGGAIFTDDNDLAHLCRSLCVHGKGPGGKYDNVRVGINSRLDAIQAAILIPKLKALEQYELAARQTVARHYSDIFAGKFVTPYVAEGCVSAYAQYALLARDRQQRDRIIAHLDRNGIPNMIYYPTPQHALPVFQNEPCYGETFPNSSDYCARTFSVPMHPYLETEDQQRIIDAVLSSID